VAAQEQGVFDLWTRHGRTRRRTGLCRIGQLAVGSPRATRAAVVGIAMAFFSVVLLFLGQDLFGTAGFVLAILVIVFIARALHPVFLRWIRGDEPLS
jgi:hypothetical protein